MASGPGAMTTTTEWTIDIATRLAAGAPIDVDDARRLGDALLAAVEGRARLDDALGLRAGPGERAIATRLMCARRDALLRQAAATFRCSSPSARRASTPADSAARAAATQLFTPHWIVRIGSSARRRLSRPQRPNIRFAKPNASRIREKHDQHRIEVAKKKPFRRPSSTRRSSSTL